MRAVLNNLCRETGAAEPILGLSAGTDTAGHDLPVEDAGAEPLQKDGTQSPAGQLEPSPGSDVSATTASFTSPALHAAS